MCGAAGAASGALDIAGPVINGLVTLGAAFAGAYFAFLFDRRRERRDTEDARVAAGNLALLTLSEIWNVLRDYQRQVVEKWRDKPDAWLNLPANPHAEFPGLSFDATGLAFLLEAEPAKVQAGLLEQRRFETAMKFIRQHSTLVLSEVFPRLSQAGVGLNEQRTDAQIRAVLGVGVVRQLTVLVDAIMKNVDEDVASSRSAFDQLRATLKTAFPGRKFLGLPPDAPHAERQPPEA